MTRLIIVLLTFVTLNLDGQCSFENFVLEQGGCDMEGDFSVTINFEYTDVGTMGFLVQGNGQSHGMFAYSDLPTIIDDLPGNCTTNWEFVIKDIEFPDCAIEEVLGEVCCNGDCSMEIVDFTTGACENGGFNLTFDVQANEDSNLSADVFINGTLYETVLYENFPTTLIDVPSQSDVENILVVCDNNNLMCCDTLTFTSPCDCSIFNVRGRANECDILDSLYWVQFDFDTNMVSDSFVIGGNGVFIGTYAYADLPINMAGPAPFHTDTAFYLIADQRNNFCFDEVTINPVLDCDTECRFDEILIETTECENGEFYALLTIETNNPGLNGFSVRGNGVVYEDSLAYGLDVYEIGPLEGDCSTLYEFILQDRDNPEFCKGEVGLTEALCCPVCEISELNVEVECEGGKVVAVFVDFNHDSSVDSMFFIELNEDTFGPYHTNEIPVTLDVDLPGTEEIRVLVYDSQKESCRKLKELIPECGLEPCPMYVDVDTEFSECSDQNTFSVFIDFVIEGVYSDSFYISVGDEVFGPYLHGLENYEVGPLASDCERTVLKFIDGDRPDCIYVWEIEEIKCCEDDCEIGEVNIEVECDGDKMVGFEIKVAEGGNQASKYQVILGDKEYGPYDYNESNYIEECLANGIYSIVIKDIEFPDCNKEVDFDVECESGCKIGKVNIEVECFDGEMNGFSILVKQSDSTLSKYQVILEGIEYIPFEYGIEQFIEVNLKDGNYTLTIIDTEYPDCKKDVEFNVDCNDEVECDYENLTALAINCTDETFMFQISVDHSYEASDLFKLFINGELIGTSSYSFLPITSTELNRDFGDAWKILIQDVNNPDCKIDLEIDEELCESSNTNLDIDLDIIRIHDGIQLESNANQKVYVKLYNIMGVELHSGEWMADDTYQINTVGIPQGIGFVVLESQGRLKVFKVLL